MLIFSSEAQRSALGFEAGNLFFQLPKSLQLAFAPGLKFMELLEQCGSPCAVGIDIGIGKQLFHLVKAGQRRFHFRLILFIGILQGLELFVEGIALFGLFAFDALQIFARKSGTALIVGRSGFQGFFRSLCRMAGGVIFAEAAFP